MNGILASLADHPNGSVSKLACAAFAGEDCLFALQDALLEEGIAAMLSLTVGDPYSVTTVTKYYTGRVKSLSFGELVLVDAAWIPDTGRLSDFLRTGKANEVEPYPDEQPVHLSMGIIVEATPFAHKLPRKVV